MFQTTSSKKKKKGDDENKEDEEVLDWWTRFYETLRDLEDQQNPKKKPSKALGKPKTDDTPEALARKLIPRVKVI